MNTRQSETWKQLVRQCETQITRQPYSSINVASQVRSDAIVAAGALVELVTPELASLLERLASYTSYVMHELPEYESVEQDWLATRALAARIREALALEAEELARDN